MPKIDAMNRGSRIYGFDYLRCLGLAMVLYQHQMSVLGREELTTFMSISVGQIGVSIFLAISGALSLRTEHKPKDWLFARLQTIYPAYWIAMIFAFIVNGIAGYKKVTEWQVISQLLGIGLFTHRGQLVNTPVWFVSLLLVLYFTIFVARITRSPRSVILALASASLLMVWKQVDVQLFCQASTFFVAALVFDSDRTPYLPALVSIALIAIAVQSREFAYPAIGTMAAMFAMRISSAPGIIKVISGVSYEFYLVHGVFILGSHKIINGNIVLSIVIGLMGAGFASWVLHSFVAWLGRNSRLAFKSRDGERILK